MKIFKELFKNFEDFILRIDSKLINKLQMEGLIKSGAFDCLESNRKFLYDAVPEIIKISKICVPKNKYEIQICKTY